MSQIEKKLLSNHEDKDFSANDSGDDISDDVHNRFLEDIKQFNGKPKIVPPTRNEPAAEVSEFNLQSKNKFDKKKSSFRKDDLLRPLRSKQPKLAQKLEAVKRTGALTKPLETVYEKKIQREVGFEKAKKQLNRWDDVVQGNRVADQLNFPLKNRKIEVYDHTDNDLFSSFSNPTPLETELAAILNSSDVAKKDMEKMEKSKFRTTLKDILAKRKMMASVRARASYTVSKARRQNKIKSKKYHRLLRSEKTKQQIKDFESLQKTDPEAALKQLEMLEKSRAEERATLRHRNTGKWARNQVIKAKYNKESRIALSEQLSKNRELTQKLKVKNSDDDSADESDTAVDSAPIDGNSSNPWVPSTNEYSQFISNYKKYWEETSQEVEGSSMNSNKHTKDVQPVLNKKKTKEIDSEKSKKKDEIIQDSSVTSVVETKKISKKSKKAKYKTVVAEKSEKNDAVNSSEKCSLVEEIMNSSGCWMVTNLPAQPDIPKMIKSKENKRKSRESTIGNNVCEMFKSLEDKISRKLKRKFSEVEETNSETIVAKMKMKKKAKNKKNKKKHCKTGNDTLQLLDQSLNNNDNGDKKKLLPATSSSLSSSYIDIDANKFSEGSTKQLATKIPVTITVGGEDIDDDEDNGDSYRCLVEEAFAEDDVVANFEKEKNQVLEASAPKIIDSSLPGWGSWTGTKSATEKKSSKAKRPRINKRLLFRVPKLPPRKDANKGHVIINEEKTNKMKEHLVSDLPYPFTQVKDFEATVRAPIGRTWIPETAHQQLVAPPVVTKLGTVIEPMDEGELIDRRDL